MSIVSNQHNIRSVVLLVGSSSFNDDFSSLVAEILHGCIFSGGFDCGTVG